MAFNNTPRDLTGRVFRTDEEISTIDSLHSPEVWKGTYTLGGQPVIVAMKVMRPMLFLDGQTAEQSLRRLLQEVGTYSTCIHPNLAPFVGVSYEVERGKRIPCLISPFYKNGSIMEYLKNNTSAVRMDLLRQFFAGLAYLHSRAIVHGNIIPTNILIDDEGNAVLADYGLSPIRLYGLCEATMGMRFPPLRYLAPELILFEDPNTMPTPTTRSDVWAAGMMGLEILSGKIPYVERGRDSGFIAAIQANKIPKKAYYPLVRHGAWSAFLNCWKTNPSERPTIQRLSDYLDYQYGPDSRRLTRPTRTRG
ncbi:kinase-like domain-containing protein [Suillus lakei]|nr:kinase-like domain-containing protein [Suillus lakei]